jgi:hypothetical protein
MDAECVVSADDVDLAAPFEAATPCALTSCGTPHTMGTRCHHQPTPPPKSAHQHAFHLPPKNIKLLHSQNHIQMTTTGTTNMTSKTSLQTHPSQMKHRICIYDRTLYEMALIV